MMNVENFQYLRVIHICERVVTEYEECFSSMQIALIELYFKFAHFRFACQNEHSMFPVATLQLLFLVVKTLVAALQLLLLVVKT